LVQRPYLEMHQSDVVGIFEDKVRNNKVLRTKNSSLTITKVLLL
jgi:hypothetical protein